MCLSLRRKKGIKGRKEGTEGGEGVRERRREKEKKKITLGSPFSLPSFSHPTNITEHYHTPGTVLGAGDREGSKIDGISTLVGFTYEHGTQTLKCMACGMMVSAREKNRAREGEVGAAT